MCEKITIAFLGDIYLGERPYISISPEITDILKSTDLVIANQEGPVTDHNKAIGGKCCLKSGIETAGILQSWGVDVVSLANNHMFDYGWEGFEQTRQQLDKAGIDYLGAGQDLKQASKPLIIELKGTKIGLLAYSWEFVQTTCASKNSFGCAPLDEKLMVKQIRDIKSQVDTVIVLPHWGYCEYKIPTPEQIQLGKRLIEAGATVVAGHHSHVVQGVVEIKNRLIAFSLGNFTFAEHKYGLRNVKLAAENLRGVIFKLILKAGKVTIHEFIHTRQKHSTIEINDSESHRSEFASYQALLVSGDYIKHWQRYLRKRLFERILYWMNILHWRNVRKETISGGLLMLKELFLRSSTKRRGIQQGK